ncbi:MAG: TraR/DksA family transcriptional regulator [Bacteroidetes bacterium]|nr:TraR/DksA family transcriptional regulator [Bacteroidota bacterium]MCB0843624.1 TraR/DksA family transcriptional regulator [Bacteroidota bacterium]MCB0851647.1 TraR/DksA family transcriptional regulator [Bacteroidota bacterium]
MEKSSEKKFYSKTELDEFRQIIDQKLVDARKEYKRLADNLKEFSGNSADSFNFTEYGNESREKEQVEILMSRQAKFMDKLEKAMIRIENGSYGICRISGDLIPKERLRVVPHATTTVDAKNKRPDNHQS